MDEDDDMKSVFGLPDNEKSHATRSASRKKNGRGKKKSRRKENKKKPRKKRPQKKRSGCSKERLFLNFRELGWDVSWFFSFQTYFWPRKSYLIFFFNFLKILFQKYIIAPVGYAAYRCRGVCDFPLSPHVNATNHAIVQVLVSLIVSSNFNLPACRILNETINWTFALLWWFWEFLTRSFVPIW